jgi:hypothetical protein
MQQPDHSCARQTYIAVQLLADVTRWFYEAFFARKTLDPDGIA